MANESAFMMNVYFEENFERDLNEFRKELKISLQEEYFYNLKFLTKFSSK